MAFQICHITYVHELLVGMANGVRGKLAHRCECIDSSCKSLHLQCLSPFKRALQLQ